MSDPRALTCLDGKDGEDEGEGEDGLEEHGCVEEEESDRVGACCEMIAKSHGPPQPPDSLASTRVP